LRKSQPILTMMVLAVLISVPAAPASAQTSIPDKLQALRVESFIKLDGILDEEAWAKAPRISNFTQRELVENSPATERTEVAVVYNGKELYIGVWGFDSQPDQIFVQKTSSGSRSTRISAASTGPQRRPSGGPASSAARRWFSPITRTSPSSEKGVQS